MAVLSTSTKGKLGVKTAGAALKNPRATRVFARAAKPAAKAGLVARATKPAAKVVKPAAKARFLTRAIKPAAKAGLLTRAVKPAAKAGKAFGKRRARQRAESVGHTASVVSETLLIQVPEAAREMGFIERPAPKRTAPRVAAGVLIGASAMYLLEPGGHGKEHREKVQSLVS